MKTLLFYTLSCLFASVYSQGSVVQNTTTFGARVKNDFLIFVQDYVIPSTLGNRMQYVVFPPQGLVNYYTITSVVVKDYNPSQSDVVHYAGNVGTGSIGIYIRAGLFRQIDARVEMYGTFKAPISEKVPCEETTTPKAVSETTASETTASETTVKETTVTEKTASETTASETTVKETTVTEETASETPASVTSASETTPSETTASETTPSETTASETTISN